MKVYFSREKKSSFAHFFFFISLQRDIIVSKEMFLRIFDVKKKRRKLCVSFFLLQSFISRRTERKSSPSLTDIGVKVN